MQPTMTLGNTLFQGAVEIDGTPVCARCKRASGFERVFIQEDFDYQETIFKCRCGSRIRTVRIGRSDHVR